MENQHRMIIGYRELNQEEIDLMNEVKRFGVKFKDLIDKVGDYNGTLAAGSAEEQKRYGVAESLRWVAIAKTDVQTGCMALTRAIAKPLFF